MHRRLSRRTVLRGLGTAIALPWLESMTPRAASAAAAAGPGPRRMMFLYVPNGIHMPAWTPKTTGTDFEIPQTLEPLAPFRDHLTVLSRLAQDGGRAHGDGPGDHARALGSFLTGAHPRKTDGADIRAGVSVDQVAAQAIGKATRFPSLELGIERGGQSGNCDSGYSCAYSSNIAWRSETIPVPKEINPRLVFDRLFASDDANGTASTRLARQRDRRSLLDFVREDAGSLSRRLSRNDARKVDEYLTSVRELERRVEGQTPSTAPDGTTRPDGVPKDLIEHIRLMLDLAVLSFQTDMTRVSTFMFANEGSGRSYSMIGVPEGHHDLSHHGRDAKKQAKLAQINRFHIEQLAYMVEKMKNVQEGESTLLDNMMMVYGSGLGDGNRHNHDDLPILLLGKGGGSIAGGRHIEMPKETPLNNLFLSMLDRMDVHVDSLGDSTGRLEGLDSA
jgi:hypothetical protein